MTDRLTVVRRRRVCLGLILLFLGWTEFGLAQISQDPSTAKNTAGAATSKRNNSDPEERFTLQPGEDPENRLVTPFLKHLVKDEEQFWTLPTRLRTQDLKWILPFGAVTAAFIASDSWFAKQVPDSPSQLKRSLNISDYGVYSLIGLGGASFVVGHVINDDHLQEAGLLSGEAAINATAVAYVLKETTQRQRPIEGNGNGNFFSGGASFPSEHSAIAWSIASVWAHEYPGWLSQTAAYGLASTIALTRVTAKEHFPSDVVVGSALGWYFGRQVYRAHHDPEVGGAGWGEFFDTKVEGTRNPKYMASPYVPLDSWIYPALQRLIGLGYVQSATLGMRPWTRMACAQMLEEVEQKLSDEGSEDAGVAKIYDELRKEFNTETGRLDGATNVGARVDSVYTRTMDISGTPLRDSYHFGQTIVNDYGRPYWQGVNNVTGAEADAELGPLAVSFRGEYQHAPARPSYPGNVLDATAAADFTLPSPNGSPEINQFQLLDSMASININNVQISFGEQSEWLGPGQAGPWLMSNNAAPFPTFKIDDVTERRIPGLSRILGPFRTEFFIGQLGGQHWELCIVSSCQAANPSVPGIVGPNIIPQPFIHGDKISFHPTANFEFGMGITAMFGGPGLPVTWGNFLRTYYAHSTTAANNPGKRISAADFTYRVPGLRDWLTVYGDSLVVDEVSPIGSTRASVSPGIYMPRIPKIPKLDFRAEWLNESRTQEFAPGAFIYTDVRRFRDGYTNDGVLVGDWIGRAGRGGEGWLTYWLSTRNKLQLGYRLETVSQKFLEGGRQADYFAQADLQLRHNVVLTGLVQYEQWRFPVLDVTRQTDVTASLQLIFYPRLKTH